MFVSPILNDILKLNISVQAGAVRAGAGAASEYENLWNFFYNHHMAECEWSRFKNVLAVGSLWHKHNRITKWLCLIFLW
jgi:hypothetical protein